MESCFCQEPTHMSIIRPTPIVLPTSGENISLQFLLNMNELRVNKVLCDITLQSDEDSRFPVHKLVLCAVSSYFSAMFQSNMAEKQQLVIRMKGIDSDCLERLIEFAYTTEIRVNVENVFSLLTAANMLCFGGVEKRCIDFLQTSLSVENCVDISTISEIINCDELQEVSTLYISQNLRQLVRQTSFLALTLSQLERVLSNEHINVSSETEIYEAVMTWVKSDYINREEHLPELLTHVRFALMSRKYLVDRVLHENVIMKHESTRNIVLKALDHLLLPERIITTSRDYLRLSRKRMETKLFVLGGELKGKAKSSVEYFDSLKSTWCFVSPMIMPRKHPGAAVLDGILYVVGGTSDQMDLITCEKFDPATETWSPIASLKHCRGALSVTVVDGWLYAIGGSNGNEAIQSSEQYDPLSNTWTELPAMRLPRSHFGSAELYGRVYVAGGYCGISEVEQCEYYEPSSGKWFEITGMNKSRMNHALVSHNQRLYAVGGKNSMGLVNSIEKYNPDINMWLVIKTKVRLRLGMNLSLNNESENLFVVGGLDENENELNDVTYISLQSPDYSVNMGTSMLENRVSPGVVFL